MPDTLDSLHRAFVAHRQTQRRGAYFSQLRRRAVEALTPGQLLQLATRLGLTPGQVARWKGNHRTAEPQGFFEVTPRPPLPAAPVPLTTPAPACLLEVEMRSGTTLRLRGEVAPQLLAVAIEALQRENA